MPRFPSRRQANRTEKARRKRLVSDRFGPAKPVRGMHNAKQYVALNIGQFFMGNNISAALAELQAITQTRLINSRECLQRLRKLKATPTIEREKELLSERIGFAIEIQKLRNGIERDRLTDADFRKYLVRNLNAVVDNRRHYDFRNKEGSDNSIFLGQFLQTMGLHPSTSDLASAINVVTTDVLETRSLRRLIERTGARIRKTNRDYLAQTEELLSERIRRIQSIPRMPIAKRMELIAYAEKALKASEKE